MEDALPPGISPGAASTVAADRPQPPLKGVLKRAGPWGSQPPKDAENRNTVGEWGSRKGGSSFYVLAPCLNPMIAAVD